MRHQHTGPVIRLGIRPRIRIDMYTVFNIDGGLSQPAAKSIILQQDVNAGQVRL